ATGVGLVQPRDGGRVLPADVSPAGLRPEDVGRHRDAAARAVVRRAAPGRPDDTGAARRVPDLVVVAPRGDATGLTADPELAARLLASGVPHLYAGVAETTGTVGPLVVPGRSPCGRCVALHRTDVDPQWPRVLAQHRGGSGAAPAACDTALATTVAGTAALHALIFLDGGSPPSLGGWVDICARDGSMRRRRLTPHQDCGCCPHPAGEPRGQAVRVQNDREHRVPILEEK
ncbi:ThiF family adenylyltransferase, partial [Streptacidiphilus monticola]